SSMAGAQVRRRDGVSAAGVGRARDGDHYRPGRAIRAMPAVAGGAPRPGRDVRIFVGRAREAVEGTRAAQRVRAVPASDRRQSPPARVVGRIARRRRSWPNRKDARARIMGARDDRHGGAAARTARHHHGHDAVVQRDWIVDARRADASDGRCGAGSDRDGARPADRGALAVRVQPVFADAIAFARHDGATRFAAGRSHPARPGRRSTRARSTDGGGRPLKNQRARHFRHGRIEIIPMIDVMFFLLVTFMLAPLSMQTLNSIAVNLPKGNAESMEHQEPITLTVTHDSKIFVDKTPPTLEQLAFVLKPMLKTNDLGVVVNADTDAPEGAVVEAMIEARRAGVEKFLIAVKH